MSTDAWVIAVAATASNGNVQQLYPVWAVAGTAKASAVSGDWIRSPLQGALHAISVQSDGTNAGTLELYDIDGNDAGADVSSLAVITDTQLDTLVAANKAKLIYQQTIPSSAGSNIVNPPGLYIAFMRGLAARFYNAGPTGTCTLSLRVTGGQRKYQWAGT